MSSILSVAHRKHLIKLLELLASDQLGERASAALKAAQFVSDKGMTWDALLAVTPPSPPPAPVDRWREDHAFCSRHWDWLTDYEKDFVRDAHAWKRPPSPKQVGVLARTAASLRDRGAR